MFESNLADFEELVLSVRDRNSREYIGEATVDYRSGCFRSAISATWVAVTYDIISKIRELAQHDAEARTFVARVDNAIALRVANPVGSKKQLQVIENELLNLAHEKFELLTDHDLLHMERLRDDRHLCAHPAFAADDQLFQPSAELVRTHIVHAISCLLQHPPIQGRAALQRLKNDLLQASFPSTQATISEFLDERYLKHIKLALVNNVITVFLKVIIKQSESDLIGKEEVIVMCLVAIQRRYPSRFQERVRQELLRLSDGCNDDELRRIMRLFRADRRCWSWLGRPVQVRVTEIVKNYTFDLSDIDAVASCLEIDELRPLFEDRVGSFTADQKHYLFSRYPHPVFIDGAIREYSGASSFRGAERLFESMIRPFSNVLGPDHVKAIVGSARENTQIYCAAKSGVQMAYLFEQTTDLVSETATEWQAFLTHVLAVYDNECRYYADLRDRMTEIGMWPIE